MAGEKTEAPTPKKLREAAERGEVWQSRELGTAMVTLGGVAALWLGGAALVAACAGVLRFGLSMRADRAVDLAMLRPLIRPLAVFAGLVLAGGVAGPLLLGPRWSGQAVVPKASRLDPLAGLRRIAGSQGLFELCKAVAKAAVLGATGWWAVGGALGLAGAPATALGGAAAAAGMLLRMLAGCTLALLVIAALDVPWQRSRWLAKLRMTRQEVRDEARESDGNPETKAAQRRMARAAARQALRPAMAEATVVTVNPSEFAVALRYIPGRDAAPVIVARGRDVIAAAIRDLAAERQVPVLRYPQLTRAIFFTGRIGQPIRDDLYGAVAAVLAYVFTVDAEAAMPEVAVPAGARFDEFGRGE